MLARPRFPRDALPPSILSTGDRRLASRGLSGGMKIVRTTPRRKKGRCVSEHQSESVQATHTHSVTRASGSLLGEGSCSTTKPGEIRLVERLCQADGSCFQGMGNCKLDTKYPDGGLGACEQRGPRLTALPGGASESHWLPTEREQGWLIGVHSLSAPVGPRHPSILWHLTKEAIYSTASMCVGLAGRRPAELCGTKTYKYKLVMLPSEAVMLLCSSAFPRGAAHLLQCISAIAQSISVLATLLFWYF